MKNFKKNYQVKYLIYDRSIWKQKKYSQHHNLTYYEKG